MLRLSQLRNGALSIREDHIQDGWEGLPRSLPQFQPRILRHIGGGQGGIGSGEGQDSQLDRVLRQAGAQAGQQIGPRLVLAELDEAAGGVRLWSDGLLGYFLELLDDL